MKAYILTLNKEAKLSEQWDFGLVKDLIEGKIWRTPDWEDFELEETSYLPKQDRAIVCIAGRHHAGWEKDIHCQLINIKKVVLFILGDEEADFDISKIKHRNISIWVQNPHLDKHDNYNRLGTGYPQRMKENLPDYTNKNLELFFSGQITHDRRRELVQALYDSQAIDYELHQTNGFTQGLEPSKYYSEMARAILAPAPSGAVIPDSFRLFEALEMMAIPIADQKTADGEVMEYWDWLFEEITPFPKIDNWYELQDIVFTTRADYPHNIHKQTEWWIKWKRNFVYKVMEQLNA
jgi:hypothetical protein